MTELTLKTIIEAVESLGDDVATVIMAQPSIEVFGEKLRIAAKNARQALGDKEDAHKALADRLDSLDLGDFSGGGRIFFSDGQDVFEASLTATPYSMVKKTGEPLWLPLIADASDDDRAWVAIADRDEPRLYRYDNGQLEDVSDRVDLPDYSDIEERREPQLDVLFHSSSSGNRTRGHGGHAKFHSLGTTQNQEEEKTEEVFHQEFAHALNEGLPTTARRLFLIGDPSRVGHITPHLEKTKSANIKFETITIAKNVTAADEITALVKAEVESRFLTKQAETLSGLSPDNAIMEDGISQAGTMGRVDKIYLYRGDAGLRINPEDEKLRFENDERVEALSALQQTLKPALDSGATMGVIPGTGKEGEAVIATARYELAD